VAYKATKPRVHNRRVPPGKSHKNRLMPLKKEAEPRSHHYVPACWLAGFTKTRDQDGELWVTDLGRQKQWATNPRKAGRIRDFYRLSDPALDPVVVEKALSKIEDAVAPTLRAIDQERRKPDKDELEDLLGFMAIQWVRGPSFRSWALGMLESMQRSQLSIALTSRESWQEVLQKAGIPPDSEGADYDGMKEFERSGEYSLVAATEWYLQRAFSSVESIAASLRVRHWGTAFSDSGSFVASDNPVALDGPKGCRIGFRNAEVVTYPLSRRVFLYGTNEAVLEPFVNRKYIAHMNTHTMRRADEQIYSHVSDFCWLDENDKLKTDWTLFAEKNYQ
jgi:hypothetical protein